LAVSKFCAIPPDLPLLKGVPRFAGFGKREGERFSVRVLDLSLPPTLEGTLAGGLRPWVFRDGVGRGFAWGVGMRGSFWTTTWLSPAILACGVYYWTLLNGQAFTNSLFFIVCCAGSGGIWLRFLSRKHTSKRRLLGALVIALHVGLIFGLAKELPRAYEAQQRFNSRIPPLNAQQGK
jgi:hypothetical protein